MNFILDFSLFSHLYFFILYLLIKRALILAQCGRINQSGTTGMTTFHSNQCDWSFPKQSTKYLPSNVYLKFPGDYAWDCEEYDSWEEQFPSPPVPASLPTTPRNGCRPPCARLPYPNFVPGKGNRGRGRNLPWTPEFPDQRFKGQRCRNGPSPYW